MRKLSLALMLALLVALLLAGPTMAGGLGVSATGLGRCAGMPDMAPGSGAITAVWVPNQAWQNHNGGNSGLIFATDAP